MRQEIERSDEQEVLFVGRVSAERVIESIEVFARGNETGVAAPAEFCERGDIVIHNHPSGQLHPSDADVMVAAQLSESGIGSAIVDNAVSRIYVLVEPIPPQEIVHLDEEELLATLSDEGAIARVLPGFLERPSQVAMLRDVIHGFNEDRVIAAEAGTGVGKSFAYLVPAVAWAHNNEERVVIATATINLQQQLVVKDLDLVQRAIGTGVKVALVKGRGNYLCPRRLEEYIDEESLFGDAEEMQGIREWAKTTRNGSRSDLPFYVDDGVWGKINSEPDACSIARCPHREGCFILKARQEAAGAQILVANHHLVFSDLAVRLAGVGWESTAVLPSFQRLIFDEAHNIERSATSFFSKSTSYYAITRQLGRILRKRGTRRFGLLDKMAGIGADASDLMKVETDLQRVRDRIEAFNAALVSFLGDTYTWRLTDETIVRFRSEIAPEFIDTGHLLEDLVVGMGRIARSIDDAYREDSTLLQFVAVTRRLREIAHLLEQFLSGDQEPDHVFWLEKRRDNRGREWAGITITPLDLSGLMEEAVFTPYPTVILTSATLAVNGTFDFWGQRIGLPDDEERVQTGQYPSPFDYSRRVLLGVPQDAPGPESEMYQPYLETFIQRAVNTVGGGVLVLFTSYRDLRSVFDSIGSDLERRGFSCYRQGNEDRGRLMELFVEDRTGVLFATDSFWEGIDAPGDTLRLVIVCRLPFRVPTDPVQRARSEAIDRRGGNSFYDFSLPQAVIKLKQGFGRLMRRTADYGAVIVTDPRMVRKPYGRVFWNSLPPARPVVTTGEELIEAIGEHFGSLQSER